YCKINIIKHNIPITIPVPQLNFILLVFFGLHILIKLSWSQEIGGGFVYQLIATVYFDFHLGFVFSQQILINLYKQCSLSNIFPRDKYSFFSYYRNCPFWLNQFKMNIIKILYCFIDNFIGVNIADILAFVFK